MARARSAVGAWSNAARPGHQGSTTPPATPVARPSTVSGPAIGPAIRLAGSPASGTEPNTGMRTGATPICAASVTPSGSRSQCGPGTRAVMAGTSTAMPALAPQERRKPIEWMRNGSARTSATTARARTRTPVVGRPRYNAVIEHAAIAHARSTDGSQRVMVPNTTRTARPATSWERSGRRRKSGLISANTNATLAPDTASR
jgi:hypothetical protein